jgi:hypothetical protein
MAQRSRIVHLDNIFQTAPVCHLFSSVKCRVELFERLFPVTSP